MWASGFRTSSSFVLTTRGHGSRRNHRTRRRSGSCSGSGLLVGARKEEIRRDEENQDIARDKDGQHQGNHVMHLDSQMEAGRGRA
jgi:hypothetical protein